MTARAGVQLLLALSGLACTPRAVPAPASSPAAPELFPGAPETLVPAGEFVPGPLVEGTGRDGVPVATSAAAIGALWMGITEITNDTWIGATGRGLRACEGGGWRASGPRGLRRTCEEGWPLRDVSLEDIGALANAMSEGAGLESAYTLQAGEGGTCLRWRAGTPGYRLPTLAEWEYAARAGTSSRFAGTDEPDAVCAYGNIFPGIQVRRIAPLKGANCDDGFWEVSPVAAFRPNGWGLYDLTGNVEEPVWPDSTVGRLCPGRIQAKGGAALESELLVPPRTIQESTLWKGRQDSMVGVRFVRDAYPGAGRVEGTR